MIEQILDQLIAQQLEIVREQQRRNREATAPLHRVLTGLDTLKKQLEAIRAVQSKDGQ